MQKMIMAIVPHDQTEPILEALVAAGYTATVTDSRGGILRQAQHLLYIAVTEVDLNKVLAILRNPQEAIQNSGLGQTKRSKTGFGRTEDEVDQTVSIDTIGFDKQVIFVWDLDHFEIYER